MKKYLAFITVCFLFTGFVASAQSKDEKEVSEAIEKLRKAMIDGDRQMLENITAEQLSYGHSSGKIDTRVSFIEDLATGKSDFVSITLSEQTITMSDNIALVRHKLMGEMKDSTGKISPINLYILLVWQKQKGKWKLVARHASRINP